MTTKNFNAKKMLMSTVAAVVFSFVFTTSANANPNAGTPQKSSLEIRVKDAPKRNVGIRVKGAQKGNVEVRVKDAPKSNLEIRVKDNPNQIEEFFMKMLSGIPRGGKIVIRQ